jgi:hypothetical protein
LGELNRLNSEGEVSTLVEESGRDGRQREVALTSSKYEDDESFSYLKRQKSTPPHPVHITAKARREREGTGGLV